MNKIKNVTILGGTGFIGRHLQQRLVAQSYKVSAYGRHAYDTPETLIEAVDGSDLLIILSGENIGQRWSEKYKQALSDSRIKTTGQVNDALQNCSSPPQKILCASAIGIYPEQACQNPVDETCNEVGHGFLGQLGEAWEKASKALSPEPTIMRFGVVLGLDGGALQKMLPPFKLGLGGPVAGGQQCFSWIHIDDLTRAIVFLAQQQVEQKTYNLCAPNPVSNSEFGRTLANVLHRPFWLPLPEWQLKLMFGEGAQVLTHSASVVPANLLQAGFEFKYPTAVEALSELLAED